MRKIFIFTISLLCAAGTLAASMHYDVEIRGIDNKAIVKTVKATSQLFVLHDLPPINTISLGLRASSDEERIVKVLNSYGYYEPIVTTKVLTKDNASPTVIIDVEIGPRFTIDAFDIVDKEGKYVTCIPLHAEALGIEIGAAAIAKKIIDARNLAITKVKECGYPFATIVDDDIIVNTTTKKVSAQFTLIKGPQARFGHTTITGLKTVNEEFIRKIISWNKGDLFSPESITTTRRTLEELSLFTLVSITYDEKTLDDGQLPIAIALAERPHRTVSTGLGYSTYYEGTATFQWRHRNFCGKGETLSLSFDINSKKQEGTLLYRIPHFHKKNNDLLSILTSSHESTEGYDAKTTAFKTILERRINAKTALSFGGGLDYVITSKIDDDSPYLLVSVPFALKWHNYKEIFDPRSGVFLEARVTPYLNTLDTRDAFLKQSIAGTIYQPLFTKDITVALTASIGSIFGSGQKNIPAPYRFYAGSANALRGYNYLTVSPLNEENHPVGGRSFLLGSLEARLRMTELLSGAIFYDIGNVFYEITPPVHKKLLRSFGVGLRYHTPIGPFRFDLAFPLNKRQEVDDSWQFYVTIGHAF